MNRIVLAVSTSPHPVRRVRARLPAFSRTLAAVALFVPALLASPLASAADAANCSNTSTGNTPLNDLGTGTYQGDQGGLYPGGSNTRPPAHDAAGLVLAEGVQPMDAAGAPDPNGKYVLLSIGMSNATIEFQAFMPLASSDPDEDPHLVIVDGAASGADADSIANPAAPYWQAVDQRLAETGVTDQQVAVAWVKEAIAHPTTGFPEYPQDLEGDLVAISQILHQRFPNLRLAYYSSRTYGGYATTDLNPEPYAYWSGFADKWLIEDQINEDPELNYDPTKGTVQAPWMSWGPYLWADGLVARSDGLTWSCNDFRDDGTHPSDLGANQVANMLLGFFETDSTSREWFLATGTAPPALSVDDVSQNEGNAGTTDFAFTVSLSAPRSQTVTVDYTTNDGTATTVDNDYSAASGTVTFVPGDTSEAVHVTVNADTKFEQNETFTVDLSNASGATIADGQGVGTILDDEPRCPGYEGDSTRNQVVGTSGADTLTGTSADDILCGLGGNDTLRGLGGNDLLLGSDGKDTLLGGAGNDTFDGGAGVDTVSFADGPVASGVTANLATGTATNAQLGNDTFVAVSPGGCSTVENLTGSGFDDAFTGDACANTLFGANGNDSLTGGGGADLLQGVGGNDTMSGGDGGDLLEPGAGDDPSVSGDAGTDTLAYVDVTTGGVSINVASFTVTGACTDSFSTLEAYYGTNSADTLTGDTGSNLLYGLGGADSISGAGGNDTMGGGAGADTIDGGNGVDSSTYFTAPGGATVNLSTGQASSDGTGSADTLANVENVLGSNQADGITGSAGSNALYGFGDNDSLSGLGGNDYLDGGAGTDTLDGGNGTDRCLNGEGTLTSCESTTSPLTASSGPSIALIINAEARMARLFLRGRRLDRLGARDQEWGQDLHETWVLLSMSRIGAAGARGLAAAG